MPKPWECGLDEIEDLFDFFEDIIGETDCGG
jgi:hypothetical protein